MQRLTLLSLSLPHLMLMLMLEKLNSLPSLLNSLHLTQRLTLLSLNSLLRWLSLLLEKLSYPLSLLSLLLRWLSLLPWSQLLQRLLLRC